MNSGITHDILKEALKRSFNENISFDNKILQLFSTLPVSPQDMGLEIWKNYLLYYPSSALSMDLIFKDVFGFEFKYDEYLNLLIEKSGKENEKQKKYENYVYINNQLQRLFSKQFNGIDLNSYYRKQHIGYPKNRNRIGNEISIAKHMSSISVIEGSLVHGHFDYRTNPLNSFIHDKYFTELNIEYIDFIKKLDSFNETLVNSIKKSFNSKTDTQSSLLILNRDNLRVYPYDNAYKGSDITSSLNIGSTYNNYHLNESFKELEYLINSHAQEINFQTFFEENPMFLLSLGNYKKLYPHLILKTDTNVYIPDFFLETDDDNFVDICEIKRPSDEIVNEMNRYTKFRDKIAVAKAQINAYREFFDDEKNRNYFESKYGLKGYKPDVVLIIGNDEKYKGMQKRKLMNTDLPPYLKIKTYPEILENAKRIMKYRDDYFKSSNAI